MRIGVIAALPGELKPLVRGWAKVPVERGSGIRMWLTTVGGNDVVAVCAGMGAAAALRAFTAAEHAGSLDLVISAGWAGALVEHLRPGGVYVASAVVDTLTGERTSLAAARSNAVLVTTPNVADEREKLRLAAAYGAEMVDMEAATVARLARMRGIAMLAIKAISDELTATLPDFNPHITLRGRLRMRTFVPHAATRPRAWASLIRMQKASKDGAEGLAEAINVFLSSPGEAGSTEQPAVQTEDESK